MVREDLRSPVQEGLESRIRHSLNRLPAAAPARSAAALDRLLGGGFRNRSPIADEAFEDLSALVRTGLVEFLHRLAALLGLHSSEFPEQGGPLALGEPAEGHSSLTGGAGLRRGSRGRLGRLADLPLRAALPRIRSLMMDEETLDDWRGLAVTEPNPYRGEVGHLTLAELRALSAVRAGDLRLEQERIGRDYARVRLFAALGPSPTT